MTTDYDEIFFRGYRSGKIWAAKMRIKKAAARNGGAIQIVRLDRETNQWIREIVTYDMPHDEIIL